MTTTRWTQRSSWFSLTALLQNLGDMLLDRSPDGERDRSRIVLIGFLVYWLLVAWLEDVPASTAVVELLQPVPGIVRPVFQWIANVFLTFFSPLVLRHLPFPVVGLWAAMWIGAYYLQDLFELKNTRVAYDYLLGAVFGRSYESITIRDGKVVEKDRQSPLFLIGGPGYVTIHLGNAAVFERVGGRINVLAEGVGHRLHGLERLREVIDLRDQHAEVGELPFITRDGLPLDARDLQCRFRIHSNQQRKESDPYPYKPVSILRAVYGQSVSEQGPGHWTSAVRSFVQGRVRDHLSQFRLDELLQPLDGDNARLALTHLFYTPETRKIVESMGAEIDWVGVGTIDAGFEINQERIQHWQDEWLRQLKNDPEQLALHSLEAEFGLQRDFVTELTRWFLEQNEQRTLTAFGLVGRYADLLERLCANQALSGEPCQHEVYDVIEYLQEISEPTILGDTPMTVEVDDIS